MSDVDCTISASCAPGDHTYSWPCVHAPGTTEPQPTILDRIIGACIEPACYAEAFVRRVGGWVAEKAVDRYVTRLSRVMSDDDD